MGCWKCNTFVEWYLSFNNEVLFFKTIPYWRHIVYCYDLMPWRFYFTITDLKMFCSCNVIQQIKSVVIFSVSNRYESDWPFLKSCRGNSFSKQTIGIIVCLNNAAWSSILLNSISTKIRTLSIESELTYEKLSYNHKALCITVNWWKCFMKSVRAHCRDSISTIIADGGGEE